MDVDIRQKFVLSFTIILLFELITLITTYYGGMLQFVLQYKLFGLSLFTCFSAFIIQVVLYLFILCQYLFDEISDRIQKQINRIEAIICIAHELFTYFNIVSINVLFLLQLLDLSLTFYQNFQLTLIFLSFIIQLIYTQTYLLFKHTQILDRLGDELLQYCQFFFEQFLIIVDVIVLLLYFSIIEAVVQEYQFRMPVFLFLLIVISEIQSYIIVIQVIKFRQFFGYDIQQAKYLNLHIKIFEATLIGFISHVFVIKQVFTFNIFILAVLVVINYTYVKLISLGKQKQQRQENLLNNRQQIMINCQQCSYQINEKDQIRIYGRNDIRVYHLNCLQQPQNPLQINGMFYRIYYSLQINAQQIQGQLIAQQQINTKNDRLIIIFYSMTSLAILSYIYYSIHYLYNADDFYTYYRIYRTKQYLFIIYIILWISTILYITLDFKNNVIKKIISIISIIILLYTYGQLIIYMNQNPYYIVFQSLYYYYYGTWFILASLLGTSLFLKLGFFIDSSIEYLQYCQNITLSFYTLSCLILWFQRPSVIYGQILKYIYLYFNLFTLLYDMVTLFYPQILQNFCNKSFYTINYYFMMFIFVIGMFNLLFKVGNTDEQTTTFCYYYLMAIITSRFFYIQIQQDNKIRKDSQIIQDTRNINLDHLQQYVQLDRINRLQQNNCNICNLILTNGQPMIISIVCNHIFHRGCCDIQNNIFQCNLCNISLEIHDYLDTVY